MSGRWASSGRRGQLPPDWGAIRQRVAERAGGRCESSMPDGTRCRQPGTECDHKDAPTDHRLTALQWLCTEHHTVKTQREAREARGRIAAQARRIPGKHPGLN